MLITYINSCLTTGFQFDSRWVPELNLGKLVTNIQSKNCWVDRAWFYSGKIYLKTVSTNCYFFQCSCESLSTNRSCNVCLKRHARQNRGKCSCIVSSGTWNTFCSVFFFFYYSPLFLVFDCIYLIYRSAAYLMSLHATQFLYQNAKQRRHSNNYCCSSISTQPFYQKK